MKNRVSTLSIGLLISYQLFSVGVWAQENRILTPDGNTIVDEEIKRVHIQKQLQDLEAQREFQPSTQLGNSPSEITPPLKSSDPQIIDYEPIQPGEQVGSQDSDDESRPNFGPDEYVHETLSRKQAYKREREIFRKELQRQFESNAKRDGIEVRRNIAEELKAIESGSRR